MAREFYHQGKPIATLKLIEEGQDSYGGDIYKGRRNWTDSEGKRHWETFFVRLEYWLGDPIEAVEGEPVNFPVIAVADRKEYLGSPVLHAQLRNELTYADCRGEAEYWGPRLLAWYDYMTDGVQGL